MRGPLHSHTFQDFLRSVIGPKNKRTYRYDTIEKTRGRYDSVVYDNLLKQAKYELLSVYEAGHIAHLCNHDEEIYLRELYLYLK